MYLVRQANFRTKLFNWLGCVGLFIFAIGGLIRVFGPKSMMVGPEGPIIGETLLLAPDLILITGAGITALSYSWMTQGEHKIDKYVAKNYQLVDVDGNPSIEGAIKGAAIGDSDLQLQFVPLIQEG